MKLGGKVIASNDTNTIINDIIYDDHTTAKKEFMKECINIASKRRDIIGKTNN